MPPVDRRRLHGEGRDVSGQHARLVLLGLLQEELLAGHADEGRGNSLRHQGLDGLGAESDLRSGGDDDQRGGLRRLDDGVSALAGLLDGRAEHSGDGLPGAGDDAGRGAALRGALVGGRHLVGIGGTPQVDVRHGADLLELLDRLVGRAVLPKTDGIVREDVDDPEPREGRDSDAAHAVPDEGHEGSAVGAQTSVGEETVGDGRHAVLSNAEADVLAVGAGGLVVLGPLRFGAVGGGKIGRSAEHLRELRNEGVDALLAELSRRDVLVLSHHELGQEVEGVVRQLSGEPALDFLGLVGVRRLVGVHDLVPLGHGRLSLAGGFGEMCLDGVRNVEFFLRFGQTVRLLCGDELFLAQRRSVASAGARLVGAALSDDGPDADHRGLVGGILGGLDGGPQVVDLVDVADLLDVPVVALVSLRDVLREAEGGVTVDGDVVIVVQDDQLAEAEVTRQARGFAGDTLLQASVTADDVGEVVEDLVLGRVVGGGQVRFGHGHSDGVGNSLSQRTGRDFHTLRDEVLGMPRGRRPELPEGLEVIEAAGGVPREVKHRVLEGAGVTVRQDEPIAVDPVRVGRGVPHDLAPEDVGHRGAAHGSSGMAGVRRLDHVGRDGADGVDAFFFEIRHGFCCRGGGVVVAEIASAVVGKKNGFVVVVVVVGAISVSVIASDATSSGG
mmetsp:Transcript_21270/g.50571  ORF Transcript_21270/g.50571 Transcript_21270/m.50571 type:complete len:670 (+) Transcript_21270:384-2393(+)